VASLNRVKDPVTLVHALRQLAARGVVFEMTFVGEDTLDGEIQNLARRLGLGDRLTFAGFMPQRALHALVAQADLMMMASRHETGPVAVLEAAALGVPTVGTAVGHLAEWAPHAAVAVPPGDAAALAGAAQELLTDEPRRLAVAHAAQQIALAEDADFTAREVLELYDRALLQRRVYGR
jgi:glycosyltransferase involved in cell wall biosynthesis